MGKSIPNNGAPIRKPTPLLIVFGMSFQLAIPRRDALQQRLAPLHQPSRIVLHRLPKLGAILNGNEQRIALKIKTV